MVSSQNTLHSVSGFYLPPIKTDHHHLTEKLLAMAKNNKQSETNQRLAQDFSLIWKMPPLPVKGCKI
jgi:hypothetical protein